ncbi:ALF repeat-containing protein [Kitasatospora sp. NPDC051914]|uniref:ALF repeat-containing protein n=1 Tax=Kitasatospora sp. NPDC051914 TaxID=3154945 RepID=UPI003417D660
MARRQTVSPAVFVSIRRSLAAAVFVAAVSAPAAFGAAPAMAEGLPAGPNTGRGVREAATKALAGTPEDRRHFLTVDFPRLRAQDNRVKLVQLISAPKNSQYLREAALKALNGSDADIEEFLAKLPSIRYADDRLKVSQLAESGGPEVKKAALAALAAGTHEALIEFLTKGLAEAEAKDKAAAGQGGTGGTQTGTGGTTVTPVSDTGNGTTAGGTGSTTHRLASTGTEAPLGGAALLAARRRSQA